jgi:hypothetical protein
MVAKQRGMTALSGGDQADDARTENPKVTPVRRLTLVQRDERAQESWARYKAGDSLSLDEFVAKQEGR